MFKEELGMFQSIKLINKYGDCGRWLIVHSFPHPVDRYILPVKKKYLPKILWRTWGHDVREDVIYPYSKNPFFRIAQKTLRGSRRLVQKYIGLKKVNAIYAVGIANAVDRINIEKHYDIKRMYLMNYPVRGQFEELQEALEADSHFDDGLVHIMVGHSGTHQDLHCEAVDALRKFENQGVKLHIMISYGNPQYIEKVKSYVTEHWHGEVEFFEKGLQYKEYAEFMNKMDAIVYHTAVSTGLGNLSMAVFLRKKMFLNRNGVIARAMESDGIPFHYTDELEKMTVDDLRRKESYEVSESATLAARSYEESVERWKKIYRDLEKETLNV